MFKIPEWADNGVRMARLGLKTGVILLGVLVLAVLGLAYACVARRRISSVPS